MGRPNIAANKTRLLYSDALVEADGNFPAFPTGPTAQTAPVDPRVLYAGDMKGAEILGFEFGCGALTTITALDATIQHSLDGVVWHTLKALTQATAAAKTFSDLDDGDPEPLRFLRVAIAATGTYGSAADVYVKIAFRQCGAKGAWAPPGMVDVTH